MEGGEVFGALGRMRLTVGGLAAEIEEDILRDGRAAQKAVIKVLRGGVCGGG
jgi:hypothetical protein